MKTKTPIIILAIFFLSFLTVFNSSCKKVEETEPTIIPIGDTYAGGIVFYLDGGVDSADASIAHGLVAAPQDQSSMGTFGEHWSNAVSLCENLSASGYNDWYLPDRTQLKTMYDNLYAGEFYCYGFQSARYWSSSEYDGISAYQIHFNVEYDGQEHIIDKSIGWGAVRAIRNF